MKSMDNTDNHNSSEMHAMTDQIKSIQPRRRAGGEQGSAILVVLLFLAMMTLVGAWATRGANTEVSIAGNETRLKRSFYRAEAAVLEAAFLLENQLSDDLKDHDSIDWLWNALNGAPNDLSAIANWDFDTQDGDDTAFETTLDLDGDGNVDATAAFAVHDKGGAAGSSLVMTNATTVRSYAVFGLQDSPEGRALIEVGYKKRI